MSDERNATPPVLMYQEEMPWESGFISTMRAIAARTPQNPQPGCALLPAQEVFRLGQTAHMAFSPREVSHIDHHDGKTALQLFSLGVWGAQGALPLSMTELAYRRSAVHDHTLVDFVDIFHHRALSLFYRAWSLSQDTVSLDRRDDERFSHYVGSLFGFEPQEYSDSLLPPHPRLASGSHLIREARNPEGLVGALHYYFGIPVRLEEYVNQWVQLHSDNQSKLGANGDELLLGDGAILGQAVADRQHKFRLILGPLTLSQYVQFSPWGSDLPILREWVRHFVSFEYAWEVSLILVADEVPLASLNGSWRLGYATWLEREDTLMPVKGMNFEPELLGESMSGSQHL